MSDPHAIVAERIADMAATSPAEGADGGMPPFVRLGPRGRTTTPELLRSPAEATTAPGPQPDSRDPAVPAGYTYLGQLITHDLSFQQIAVPFGTPIGEGDVANLQSPALVARLPSRAFGQSGATPPISNATWHSETWRMAPCSDWRPVSRWRIWSE
jgi:hypothetical protein